MQAEVGGLASCSFVRATSSAANREAKEEVDSLDRVWPPSPSCLRKKNMTAPPPPLPHLLWVQAVLCGLLAGCQVGPSPRWWGRG